MKSATKLSLLFVSIALIATCKAQDQRILAECHTLDIPFARMCTECTDTVCTKCRETHGFYVMGKGCCKYNKYYDEEYEECMGK